MNAITASDFKATCLDLLDRVSSGELDQVVVSKRGRIVGVLNPPPVEATPDGIFGCMAGSVVIADGVDLTAPVSDRFDAADGLLHR